jgi:hypothetical protein
MMVLWHGVYAFIIRALSITRRAGEKMNRPVSMEEIVTLVCKRYGLEPTALVDPGKKLNCSEIRALIALLVWYENRLARTDLSTRLDPDLGSLSQAVNRLRKRARANPSLAAEVER